MEKLEIYDRDFKMNVAKIAIEKGVSKTAKELELPAGIIYKWRDRYRKFGADGFCGGGQFRNADHRRLSEHKRILKQKLKDTEIEIEIFKSASKYILKGKPMIFYFIEENLHRYPLWKMCKVLGIIHRTYYRWRDNVLSRRECHRNFLESEITAVFYEYKGRYGNGKISAELQSRGIQLSKCRVTFYMKRLGLVSKLSCRHKVKSGSSFSGHNPCIFSNILNRQFKADEPSQVWVSGITSLETTEGLLFLTIIMDLFDSKVVGWNLSTGLTIMETSMPAWEMAIQNCKLKRGLIFHSDRSPQYANKMFTRKLDSYKYIKRSMSRAENHLDNAVVKSFFISLKSELASLIITPTKEEMEEKISEYLEQALKIFKYKLL